MTLSHAEIVQLYETSDYLEWQNRWGYDGLGTPGPKLPYARKNYDVAALFAPAPELPMRRYYTPGNPMRKKRGK